MADFADKDDVVEAAGGDLPSGSNVAYQLEVVNARLRLLMPSLSERITGNRDLATLARDVVVQAVIRRMGSNDPAVRSVSQGVGPWSTTLTYERDRAGIFSDDDLTLLGEQGGGTDYAGIGTIHIGRPDWSMQ